MLPCEELEAEQAKETHQLLDDQTPAFGSAHPAFAWPILPPHLISQNIGT
jgi:hypothetical protein